MTKRRRCTWPNSAGGISGPGVRTLPSDLILYDRCHPSYPAAALDTAKDLCPIPPTAVVADVGCGTGIFAEQLLASGYTVFGVEPVAAMRELAAQRVGDYPTYCGVAGSAECTTLPTGSVDLVTAASALHCFSPLHATTEFRRILRAPKWLVALWNFRVATASAFSRAFDLILRDHLGPEPQGGRQAIENGTVPRFFSRNELHRRSFGNPLRCTEAQLLGLVFSASNAPSQGSPRWARLEAAVTALYRAHNENGTVTVPYETVLYCGRLA